MESEPAASASKKAQKIPMVFKLLRWSFRNVGRVAPGPMSRLALRFWFTPNRRPRVKPDQEKVLDKAKAVEISSEGEKLTAYTWGEEGPAVFLIHGWEGRAAQMTGFVEPLLAAGFRVVALDAPGHGKHPKRRVRVQEITAAIARTAEELGPFQFVITHSLSTLWTSVAIGREGWPTERAVCIAGVTDMDPMLAVFSTILDVPEKVSTKLGEQVNAAMDDDFWSHSVIKIPALLIHDRDDDFIPHEVGEKLVKEWPDARLHTTEKLGHRKILADSEVIAKAVEFLAPVAASKTDNGA